MNEAKLVTFIVILAGGGGERLWPKSRKNFPKQCISLNGKQSLIQKTYDIAVQIVGEKNILISTRKELASVIRKQLPHARMAIEPLGRDSAAGMGYVCAQLLSENIDEATIFMGSDYNIPDITQFKGVLEIAVQWAEKGKISAIGIKPTRVDTRFGYINPGKLLSSGSIHVYKAKSFTEKPDEVLAREYIAHGYLWNSGMFVVKPSVLYQNIRQYMPGLYDALERIQTTNFDEKEAYNAFISLPKVSIDFGVMEKTPDLVVVRGDFIWDDIGTWDSLDRILKSDLEGNVVQGDFLGVDVQDSIIFSEKPIIAFGISNIVLIDTQDCTFICHKNKARNIKQIIKELEDHPHLKRLLTF